MMRDGERMRAEQPAGMLAPQHLRRLVQKVGKVWDATDRMLQHHEGELCAEEMSEAVGMSTDEVQASRLEIARNFAVAHHVYVVLKGHRTLIATPDEKVFINPTGNPGMATGGTGDVLTGIVAAWLALLLDAESACKLAVYLHGAAGDLAASDEGEVAMTASDIVARLGRATKQLTVDPGADGNGA